MVPNLNLSCMTTVSFDIPLDEVTECVFDQRHELLQCIQDLHSSVKFFNGHYSVYLTDWHGVPSDDRIYLSLVGMFDVHNDDYLVLRVTEGYKSNEGSFFEGDAFLDIKVDKESLTQAVHAMKNGTIPLYNKGIEITKSSCPYALIYDEE